MKTLARKSAQLEKAVKAIVPNIDGVSIGDPDDRRTWSVQYKKVPTEAKIAAIDAVIAAIDLNAEITTDYPLSPFQFFTFLEQLGLTEATVDAAIDSIEADAMKRIEHKRRFRHATSYHRDNPLLVSLVSAVGKTAKDIDTAWMAAKDLK